MSNPGARESHFFRRQRCEDGPYKCQEPGDETLLRTRWSGPRDEVEPSWVADYEGREKCSLTTEVKWINEETESVSGARWTPTPRGMDCDGPNIIYEFLHVYSALVR